MGDEVAGVISTAGKLDGFWMFYILKGWLTLSAADLPLHWNIVLIAKHLQGVLVMEMFFLKCLRFKYKAA